jgi:hypothetical protein
LEIKVAYNTKSWISHSNQLKQAKKKYTVQTYTVVLPVLHQEQIKLSRVVNQELLKT